MISKVNGRFHLPQIQTRSLVQAPTHVAVFVFSLAIFFLEATLFSTLLFTHTYLIAIQSIAFALLGIGLGAIIGTYLLHKPVDRYLATLFLGFILSIPAIYLNITLFPTTVAYSPLIIAPFLFGSAAISVAIGRESTSQIYFLDLAGAALGVVAYVLLLPLWGEEGNFFLLATVLAFVGYWLVQPSGWHRFGWWGLQLLFSTLLLLHLFTNQLNLANLTRCYQAEPPRKTFCKLTDDGANSLVFSKSDLAARIDLIQLTSSKTGKQRTWIQYNGITADKISASKPPAYINDRRIPHGIAEQPDVLVIGTAGDGIIKPAHLLAGENGRLDGVEINAGLVSLMTQQYYQASGQAYGYLDNLFIGDARTYLNTHDQRYGVITLLNTYTGRLQDSLGAPEYLHTVEAMTSYLYHLTADGFLIFEVRDVDELARVSGLRLLNALFTAQAQAGDTNPQDNFYIYEYYPNSQRIARSNNYTMILFKKSAFTADELVYMNTWVAMQNENTPTAEPRTNILHLPDSRLDNEYSQFVATTAAQRDDLGNGRWLTTPTTDNRPFFADADRHFPEVKATVSRTALIISLLALLLLVVIWRGQSATNIKQTLPFLIFFACTGLGYLLIEIALIQSLQIFTGLPAYTFVFVLGTLLLFSGLGSYFSERLGNRQLQWIFILLIATIGLSAAFIRPLMLTLQTTSLGLNALLVAALLFPLAFLMGIPTPVGLRLFKAHFSPRLAALGFGWNSLFATLGTSLAIFVALIAGFNTVFIVGIALYLIAFITLLFIIKQR